MAAKPKTRRLTTVNAYQESRRNYFEAIINANKPHPNGVACPTCEQELWDSNPSIVLTSMPPQKNVHCPICGYVGYLLA